MTSEHLSARLRAAFLGELQEQVLVMNEDLLALERTPTDMQRLKSLFRVAHTLKGAARAAAVPEVERACHAIEGMLARARDHVLVLDERAFALLYHAADALADARERMASGAELSSAPIAAVADAVAQGRAPTRLVAAGERVPAAPKEQPASVIRVSSGALDDLIASTVELRHARSRLASRVVGFEREMRGLGEAVDDLMRRSVGLRMRPFSEICEALPRMARDLATEDGKDVRLDISGGDVEADRAVLDALREPLVHLVRNAISHGIESPSRRSAAGKPPSGTVSVSAALRGELFIVTVSDDGAGIDPDAARGALTRAGRTVPAGDDALARAVMEGGFSTRDSVSALSGRGVGLDLIRAAVERIGGAARVHWQIGRGTTFTLESPVTLASIRVVLVTIGSHSVAIPTAGVERLRRIAASDVLRAEGRDMLAPNGDGEGAESPIPVLSLARVLGAPYADHPLSATELTPAVVMQSGEARVALVTDGLVDECEITVRPLDARIRLPLLSGVAILGSGAVAPVLNPAMVVTEALRVAGGGSSIRAAATTTATRRRILVVDDSITTRTLEQSVLEAAGYEVITAPDGADAWRALQEQGCDLVVSDVEMPRMDGFALCEAIRGSPRFRSLPVVLVTALESQEQRARGLQAGANAYLGKSVFDQQALVDVVAQYLE